MRKDGEKTTVAYFKAQCRNLPGGDCEQKKKLGTTDIDGI
jgi:hypothetical protein